MSTTGSSTRNRRPEDAVRSKVQERLRERATGRRETRSNGHAPTNRSSSSGWSRHGTALPGWTDLEPSKNKRRDTTDESFLENVSTLRFALLVLLIAGGFTLYVGHVHATKDLLNKVQEARAENQTLHLKRNRLKGEFDRRTGPSVIYERAREIGLEASVTYGPPITIDD